MEAKKEDLRIARKILEFIHTHDNFLISAHINADGDAVASVIAVHLLLNTLNKFSVMVLSDPQKDQRYNFLSGFDHILHYTKGLSVRPYLPKGKIESAILLDVPGYGRLGDVQKLLPAKANVLKIDHHPFEDVMGELEWMDVKMSSTAAMVYEVAAATQKTIGKDLAQAIYTGILYDTGRFSFSNTRARDFFIASQMVALGVEPAEITNRLFFENSFNALKTIGLGLASLENYLNGAVNVIYLDNRQLQNQNQNEIEELANYSVAVRGGQIGLFVREIKPGFHKVSLRSKSHVDVNQVAKVFNGGGHTRAAGCRIEAGKEETIQRLLEEIKKQL